MPLTAAQKAARRAAHDAKKKENAGKQREKLQRKKRAYPEKAGGRVDDAIRRRGAIAGTAGRLAGRGLFDRGPMARQGGAQEREQLEARRDEAVEARDEEVLAGAGYGGGFEQYGMDDDEHLDLDRQPSPSFSSSSSRASSAPASLFDHASPPPRCYTPASSSPPPVDDPGKTTSTPWWQPYGAKFSHLDQQFVDSISAQVDAALSSTSAPIPLPPSSAAEAATLTHKLNNHVDSHSDDGSDSSPPLLVFQLKWSLDDLRRKRAKLPEIPPQACIRITGNAIILDKNGKVVTVHLRDWLGRAKQNDEAARDFRLRQAQKLDVLARNRVLTGAKDGEKRHLGQHAQGSVHVGTWAGTGHSHPSEFRLARDCTTSTRALGNVAQYGQVLEPQLEMAHVAQRVFNPVGYERIREHYEATLRDCITERELGTRHFVAQGFAMVHDLPSRDHYDCSDDDNSLAIMQPLGNFDGGQLHLRDFGLLIEYEDGDLAALYGNAVAHAVEGYDGRRHSLVVWNHSDWLGADPTHDWPQIRIGAPTRYGCLSDLFPPPATERKEVVGPDGKIKVTFPRAPMTPEEETLRRAGELVLRMYRSNGPATFC